MEEKDRVLEELFLIVCMFLYVIGGEQRHYIHRLDPLELQLKAVVSQLAWVLGTKLWSS